MLNAHVPLTHIFIGCPTANKHAGMSKLTVTGILDVVLWDYFCFSGALSDFHPVSAAHVASAACDKVHRSFRDLY